MNYSLILLLKKILNMDHKKVSHHFYWYFLKFHDIFVFLPHTMCFKNFGTFSVLYSWLEGLYTCLWIYQSWVRIPAWLLFFSFHLKFYVYNLSLSIRVRILAFYYLIFKFITILLLILLTLIQPKICRGELLHCKDIHPQHTSPTIGMYMYILFEVPTIYYIFLDVQTASLVQLAKQNSSKLICSVCLICFIFISFHICKSSSV